VALRTEFAAAPHIRPMGIGRDLIGARKDGSEFYVEVGLNPAVTSLGNVVVVTVVDVTERKLAAEDEIIRDHAFVHMQVCQQLGMPAVVLRHDGRALLMNLLFKRVSSQFSFREDWIEVSNPAAREAFKQALSCLAAGNGEDAAAPNPVFAATGDPPLILHLLPLNSDLRSAYGILVVTMLGATDVPSSDLVQRLFTLAPAEARVAALIGSGLSPRQAAEKLNISEGTVRTTLKHVFTRVGVSRQSELVALLAKLTGPAADFRDNDALAGSLAIRPHKNRPR
jgi:DNA-binding CsgD family transcriptional regulator